MRGIVVERLCKTFAVAEREPGLWGATKGLLARRFKEIKALDDLSFRVEPGELVGYIGPNGAGKSTTIKVLAGILTPSSGECVIDGLVPWRQRARHVARIGAVFGQRTQLWWDLPVRESFDLLASIYRVPVQQYRQTVEELIALLDLAPLLDTPTRQLSLGQRMRCDLVAALVHSPEILFLDEPTIGLDVVSKLAVRDFVKRLNRERGATVLLTTHDMDDIETLCDRIMLINYGRLVFDGSLARLRGVMGDERRLRVEVEGDYALPQLDHVRCVEQSSTHFVLAFDPNRVGAAAVIGAVSARVAVRDLMLSHRPVEEIVAASYSQSTSALI